MRRFLGQVSQPADEWKTRLELLARDGNYTAALGAIGQNRVSRSACDNEFLPAFRRYLEALPNVSADRKTRLLWVLGPVVLLVITKWTAPAAASPSPNLGLGPSRLKIAAGIGATLAAFLGLSIAYFGTCQRRSPRSTSQLSTDAPSLATTRGGANGAGRFALRNPLGARCFDYENPYDVRRCLLEVAEGARRATPNAARDLFLDALNMPRWDSSEAATLIGSNVDRRLVTNGDPRFVYDAQSRDALDGLASIAFAKGDTAEAAQLYLRYFDAKQLAAGTFEGLATIRECGVLAMLARTVKDRATTAAVEHICASPYPSNTHVYRYEAGRLAEQRGEPSAAIAAYAQEVAAYIESEPANAIPSLPDRWAGLLADQATTVTDAIERIEHLADGSKISGAAIVGGILFWQVRGDAPAVTAMPLPADVAQCAASAGRRTWRVRLVAQSTADESENRLIVSLPADGMKWPQRFRAEVTLIGSGIDDCLPQHARAQVCLFEDGRFEACP